MSRTFGWVQNPSSFDNLKKVVQIFIVGSEQHRYLVDLLSKGEVIEDEAVRERLREVLAKKNVIPTYKDLVGTGCSDRKKAKCDALAQASIKPQNKTKRFVDNWSADGFVRWAECLGFIRYMEQIDGFCLTKLGRAFGEHKGCFEDNKALAEGLMKYPPVSRVLEILADNQGTPCSKFVIGAKLGFNGEPGFTSFAHDLIVSSLAMESSQKEVTKIRQDVEGSSDKYARMIASWLMKIGWVEKSPITIANPSFPNGVKLGHSFKITLKGLQVLKNIRGNSKNPAKSLRVTWYMLATNAKNSNYLRTRRSTLLKLLNQGRTCKSPSAVMKVMADQGYEHTIKTYEKDLKGLVSCGIDIEISEQGYRLLSRIDSFDIPANELQPVVKDRELEIKKEELLAKLKNIEPEWVELLEISRDGTQNRLFESKVIELLGRHYKLQGKHLGGSSKPDGVAYAESADLGLIIDTKAYKEGFRLSASENDKMTRYVQENNLRDAKQNPNQWWREFPEGLSSFYYLFVSSTYGGRLNEQLESIAYKTNRDGGALEVEQLLLGADYFSDKPAAFIASEISSKLNNARVVFK